LVLFIVKFEGLFALQPYRRLVRLPPVSALTDIRIREAIQYMQGWSNRPVLC